MTDWSTNAREAITDAYEGADRVLVESLPTMGKSYGAVAAVEALPAVCEEWEVQTHTYPVAQLACEGGDAE